MILLCGLCGWRSVRLALSITPDSAEYHFRLWQARAEEVGNSLDELDHALKLNPRYAEAWIARGLQQETAGDRNTAEASLLRAAGIDHLYLPLWTLANFYLRAGDLTRFWIWARRAAEMSYDPAALFQLCWRASGDTSEIFEHAIPAAPVVRRAYLDFLVRSDRLDAAEPLAVELGRTANPDDLDLLLRYCDALLTRRQVPPALRVWNALAARRILPYPTLDPAAGSSLTNGDLAVAPLQRGFDWRPTPVEGVVFSVNADARQMTASLSGKQPESCSFVEQYLPVLPNRKYRFRYRYRTRDLAADTGLSWILVEARTAAEIAAAAVSASPEDWREQSLAFSTPPNCDLLRVILRYRRPPGRVRAEGFADFGRFALEAVEGNKKIKRKKEKKKNFTEQK